MLELISRKEAKAAGLSRYNTGKLCRHGHLCERQINGYCIECRREQGSIWRKITGFARKRNKIKRDANPEKHRERLKKWSKANPGAIRAIQHVRRARKRGAEGKYVIADLHGLLEQQGLSCRCGISFLAVDPTIDHKTPLSRGGSNWPNNIQLLCLPCNMSKGNKTMEEWKATA